MYQSPKTPLDSASRFAASWLLPPAVFFVWRALVSFYAFMVLFISIGLEMTHGGRETAQQSFGYFTILGYWGLAFYFGVAAFHSADYWRHGRVRLQSWPRLLQWAHSCLYTTVTVFPFVVTIIFWTAIANGAFDTKFDSWTNISQHALNSVLAFSEIALPCTTASPWTCAIALIVLLGAYVGMTEIIHATQGWYPYTFLDPQSDGVGGVVGACVIVLIVTMVVFGIVQCLITIRQWFTEQRSGKAENVVAVDLDSPDCEARLSRCDTVMVYEAMSKEIGRAN